MIDKTRPEKPRPMLPAFTPVPRQCARHDGWTPERQQGFIEALADTGSVRAAANAVNMAPEGAYMLRRHPQATGFRKAWEAALALGVQRLEDIALERALHGVEVPVYSYGKLVGTRRTYNDRLLMFMLRARSPSRFRSHRARGMDAASKAAMARQKREWRKEWEAEQKAKEEAERRDSDKILDSINNKIQLIRERSEAEMSPRTRRLWDAYQTSSAADSRRARAYCDDEDEADEQQVQDHDDGRAPVLRGPSIRLV